MELRSLIFREFKVAKKIIIVQAALLISFMALTWGMLFSDDNTSVMLDVIIIITAFVSMMSWLMDENLKSDINSGWLNYSYALPVKPLERTAARFVQKLSAVVGGALLSIGNSAVLCALSGKPFSVNYIVWYIVILAAIIMLSLPNELFLLRSRSSADMKKMQTFSGLTTFGLMVVVIAGIFIANDVTLEKLVADESFIKLPVFTASSLIWAVPLLIIMIASDFFISYLSLRSAYPNSAGFAKNEKKSVEIARPQTALSGKTKGLTGLLYKELKQNRLIIILAALTPIFLTAFPFCFSAFDAAANHTGVNGVFALATNIIIRALMYVCGIFIISGLMSEVFRGDDRKLWAYFVVSIPQGVKGFIRRKYVLTLMINLVYITSGLIADKLLAAVTYSVTGSKLMSSMSSAYLWCVILLMFISAVDIPFAVRYGSKIGSIIKMTIMILLCTAATVTFSFIPEDLLMKITESIISLFNGTNNTLSIIKCILPFAALTAFLLSCKIAYRAFIKGVEEYVK